MVEIRDSEASGILRKEPLLLRACKAGAYGNSMQYDGGAIYQAHFTYLCGIPNQTIYLENPELFLDKLLVCMSLDWENFIRKQQRLDQILLRRLMKPLIVMHDAMGVRQETGKQAKVINSMVELINSLGRGELTPEETLKEFVVHTRRQVVVGAVLGSVIALVME